MKMFNWLKEFISDKKRIETTRQYDNLIQKEERKREEDCISDDYFKFILNRLENNSELFEVDYEYGDYIIKEIGDNKGIGIRRVHGWSDFIQSTILYANRTRIILNKNQHEIMLNLVDKMIQDYEFKKEQDSKRRKEFELNEYRKKHE